MTRRHGNEYEWKSEKSISGKNAIALVRDNVALTLVLLENNYDCVNV